jgi:hypothetical protein
MDSFEPGPQSDGEWAICPYCGRKVGDCCEWVIGAPREVECYRCGKVYTVWAEYDVTYYTEPSDSAKAAPQNSPEGGEGK